MPWTTDITGDKVYKLSIYAKEELPTWSEVYEEFYLKKYYEDRTINPNDPRWTESDPYWKIPHYQFLLATVCNQFNKTIFEDGFLNILINALTDKLDFIKKYPGCRILDIKFTCHNWFDNTVVSIQDMFIGLQCAPPIYTIPHPDGKENPFITDYERISLTDLTDPLVFRPIIDLISEDNTDHIICEPLPDGETAGDFNMIMDAMIDQYRSYFEGSGVGWKDENGNLLADAPIKSVRCSSGFDPAL